MTKILIGYIRKDLKFRGRSVLYPKARTILIFDKKPKGVRREDFVKARVEVKTRRAK